MLLNILRIRNLKEITMSSKCNIGGNEILISQFPQIIQPYWNITDQYLHICTGIRLEVKKKVACIPAHFFLFIFTGNRWMLSELFWYHLKVNNWEVGSLHIPLGHIHVPLSSKDERSVTANSDASGAALVFFSTLVPTRRGVFINTVFVSFPFKKNAMVV